MLRAYPLSRAYALLLLLSAAGCASGGGPAGQPLDPADAAWYALATPRPEPLDGAARLSVGTVELLGDPAWGVEAVSPSLGLSELIATGLLRRRDVHFVERRRFGAAIQAERSGSPRPPEAPAIGTSPGSELEASLSVLPLGAGQATVEVRIVDPETGAVRLARRVLVPADADPVGLARASVAEILAGLSELGRLPSWNDAVTATPGSGYIPSGVAPAAVGRFMAGLDAEESWDWEEAREAYEAATGGGFFEAEAALARTARLRVGGTLGES